MKYTHAAGAPLSERDVAWFEEVAEAVARGCAARADGDAALSLLAAADAGAPTETALRRMLATDPRPAVGAAARRLTALARSGNATRQRCFAAVHETISFLLAAQNPDGGWPALARDTAPEPSCPLATASAVEALGQFGFRVGQVPVDEAVAFLLARQAGGAGSVQTTWQMIAGLRAVGADVFALPVRRAVRWLKESQTADGGWSDSASETAWAVLGLLAAGDGECPEVRAGAEFLIGTQHADGSWTADDGFELLALARYRADRATPAEVRTPRVRTDAGHRTAGPKSYRHTLAEM